MAKDKNIIFVVDFMFYLFLIGLVIILILTAVDSDNNSYILLTSCVIVPMIVVFIFLSRKNNIELRNQEALVKKIQLRFDLAVQGSNAGIYEWDIVTGNIIHNSIVDTMLGYSEKELPDLTLEGFMSRLHPDDLKHVGEAVQNHLAYGTPYEVEFRMRKKDDSYLWVADSGMSLRNEKGIPILWAGTMINIDHRKKSEEYILAQNETLSKVNAELDLLVHRVSHDLKSPLASILGLVKLINLSKNSQEIIQYTKYIEERAKALDLFIQEIIEVSKGTKAETCLEQIRLLPLVQKQIETLSYNEGTETIEFELNVEKDFTVITDRLSLTSILINLIGNAIKYHDREKTYQFIRISASTTENTWRLSIEDNGKGIDQQHHDKIFNIFYRASSDSKGSGLGLHLVKESIKKLGGEIKFKSVLNEGSCFQIEFKNEAYRGDVKIETTQLTSIHY